MKTEYLPSFIKDLKKLKKTLIYSENKTLAFQTIPACQNFTVIQNFKKIKGHKDVYRIKKSYWLIQNETVIFSRVLHRKDVYRYFP